MVEQQEGKSSSLTAIKKWFKIMDLLLMLKNFKSHAITVSLAYNSDIYIENAFNEIKSYAENLNFNCIFHFLSHGKFSLSR